MSTIRTYTGVEIPMLKPKPSDIMLEDIAHGLAHVCRFNGQADCFYSVAEHSVLVADLLRSWGSHPDLVLAGLFHDAAEAYIGDVTSPLKAAMRTVEGSAASSFDVIETTWVRAVSDRFGLTQLAHADVKRADLAMLEIENHVLRRIPMADESVRAALPVSALTPLAAKEFFLAYARLCGVADA